MNLGDLVLGTTHDFPWPTDVAGVPTSVVGTAVMVAYEDNSTTEITAGITFTVDFDGKVGKNRIRVVATSGNGFAAGHNYSVQVASGITLNGVVITPCDVGYFSITDRSAALETSLQTLITTVGADGAGLTATATAVWDALTSALTTVGSIGKRLVDNIDVVLSTRLATSGYTAPMDAAATRAAVGLAIANIDTQLTTINNKTTNLPSDPADQSLIIAATDAIVAAIAALNNLSSAQAQTAAAAAITAAGIPTANANADALLDRVDGVEVGLTLREAHRLEVAATAGKLSGAATATVVIRNAKADSKNRITATVDADGNRTALVLDLT